jgi:hypothetical protein
MIDNPYESPKLFGDSTSAASQERVQGQRSFRTTAFVLFLPAIYNYWAFDAGEVSRLPDDLANLCRTANILGLVVGGVLIWFLGLPSLELLSRFLRGVFAGGTDHVAWQGILYRSLSLTPYLAVPGAALWAIWVFCFYQLNTDFYVISWSVGIPAHLLGACWYVPLIYRWYRLAAGV